MAAAKRELHEETKLDWSDLQLGFTGVPFSFSDVLAQRSWTVHPFGWTLLVDDSKIKLDWEHDSWSWYEPEHVDQILHDCVPRLETSLRRVFFGNGGIFGDSSAFTPTSQAGIRFTAGLNSLRNDKTNGARVLATNAVETLRSLIEVLEDGMNHWRALQLVAYHLIYSGRPSMNAAIGSAVIDALSQIQECTAPLMKEEALAKLEDCINKREAVSKTISEACTSFIQTQVRENSNPSVNILTISSSSTIASAIINLLSTRNDIQVNAFILESRPACEGVSMAAELLNRKPANARLHITIAPDSHAAFFAQKLNSDQNPAILLIGADRISPSGHVSNKMGSCAAAVLMKTFATSSKVVVLSETDKIAKPTNLELYRDGKEDTQKEMTEHSPESNDTAEVRRIWEGMTPDADQVMDEALVENVYFEWVPNKYIDEYITELGPLDKTVIRSKSLDKAKLEEETLGNLDDG